ncbi:hypothetical protein ACFY3U_09170 [Micromonospora sp. NPDC000089]|uniref:hypothetical protein n=1 Tax=unclassified Micromonospora TaxID=2617518 RepID=UPI0036A91D70
MTELPLHILTEAGFTSEEANSIVDALLKGVDLHDGGAGPGSPDIDALSPEKKDALERFNIAVAADG